MDAIGRPKEANPCDLISEIGGRPEQLKLVVGAINYLSTAWDDLHITRDDNAIRDTYLFKKAIIDAYVLQFVNFPTRASRADNPSCIDWLFASNEVLINRRIKGSSPLWGSNYIMIEADLNIMLKDSSTDTKFYYNQGNCKDTRNFVSNEIESMGNMAMAKQHPKPRKKQIHTAQGIQWQPSPRQETTLKPLWWKHHTWN